ncbi:MAG TPA: HD domain-containing phosphohydrolase [Pirellulales bacterium]|nr:HD domain-containing phosphohydrolase [Pirellulales bacterium]
MPPSAVEPVPDSPLSDVLFVDDDATLLASVEHTLRGRYAVTTASSPVDGINAVRARGSESPFEVVVADMQMPGMNGVEFLRWISEISPASVRIMLTGQSDQRTTRDALNHGNIFRFLTKPYVRADLIATLQAGVHQFQLLAAEKELLAKTLGSSVKLLAEVLALVKPRSFGRATRVRRLVQPVAGEMRFDPLWHLEIGATLSQLGCVTLPEPLLEKAFQAKPLTRSEWQLFFSHAKIGAELVGRIPRMEPVAEIIAYQEKRFDGSGFPSDDRQGSDIPLGARILKVALDLDALQIGGMPTDQALVELGSRDGWYDPDVLGSLARVLNAELAYERLSVSVDAMADGMVLVDHILSEDGSILVTRGQEVTATLRHRLANYIQSGRSVRQPIQVLALAVPPGECLVS